MIFADAKGLLLCRRFRLRQRLPPKPWLKPENWGRLSEEGWEAKGRGGGESGRIGLRGEGGRCY